MKRPAVASLAASGKPRALVSRFRRVKLLLCDVDGVLTDGTVWIGQQAEWKRFSILDGMGLALLRKAGIRTGWISSRPSSATTRRATELKVDFLHQAKTSKTEAVEGILKQTGFGWGEVCYVGDDLVDLPPMRRAGVAVAVVNAVPEVRAAAHWVTSAEGGRGAVRQVVEMILKAQGWWRELLAEYEA